MNIDEFEKSCQSVQFLDYSIRSIFYLSKQNQAYSIIQIDF